MIIFHGDPLMRRVAEIIDRVVVAVLYNYSISLEMNELIVITQEIDLAEPLDG
jgi:hypothetical protein